MRGLISLEHIGGAIERDEPPEGTSFPMSQVAEALVQAAKAAWRMAMTNTSPRGRYVFEWMQEPRLGDWVLVDHVAPSTPAIERVGIYHCAWSYERQEVHQVRRLDGVYTTWSNVDLIRVPDGTEFPPWQQLVTG